MSALYFDDTASRRLDQLENILLALTESLQQVNTTLLAGLPGKEVPKPAEATVFNVGALKRLIQDLPDTLPIAFDSCAACFGVSRVPIASGQYVQDQEGVSMVILDWSMPDVPHHFRKLSE